jgi:hypothetical protein
MNKFFVMTFVCFLAVIFAGCTASFQKKGITGTELSGNITVVSLNETIKRIKARGWGEYRVAGKCLCCDNMLDGDCVVIANTERTKKSRIPQIVDGKKPLLSDNREEFFGELLQRDEKKYATYLYINIKLPEEHEIRKIVVWTHIKEKKSLLSNCEVGYVDQFGRLCWIDKFQDNKFDNFISFAFTKPVTTKEIMLRVKDGRNRITEVEMFAAVETVPDLD